MGKFGIYDVLDDGMILGRIFAPFVVSFLLLLCFAVLGIKPRASHMLGKFLKRLSLLQD
jgi:hypothetical protein